MDYPAPRVGLVEGAPDLSDAYGVGLGRWDMFAVLWLYGARDEQQAAVMAERGVREGLRFVADQDARPLGTGQPWGGLWDDAADPLSELRRVAEVRRAAVDRFGLSALAPSEPVANLRRKFVPIWLLHRYQVESAVKLLGGVDYAYSVRGDGREAAQPVAEGVQRQALDALLDTLRPEALRVPPALLPYLSAGWSGNPDRQFDIEVFRTAGSAVFDPLAATDAAAGVTINALLAPERLNRLAIQNQVDTSQFGAHETVDRLIASTFEREPEDPALAAVSRRIATTTALSLARVQRDPLLHQPLALALDARLRRLAGALTDRRGDEAERDWANGLARLLLDREALDKAVAEPRRLPAIPPGMPIGGAETDGFHP